MITCEIASDGECQIEEYGLSSSSRIGETRKSWANPEGGGSVHIGNLFALEALMRAKLIMLCEPN